MDTQQQILVEQKVANTKKSTGVAYLLWFFLGGFGAHRFYLGKAGTGAAIAILLIGGLILSPVMIGIPMVIAGLVWIVVDLFLIPSMVDLDAQRKRRDAVLEVSAYASSQSNRLPAE